MSAKEEKKFGRLLQTDGAALKQRLLEEMNGSPTENELVGMGKVMERLIGKLQTSKKVHLISALSNALSLGIGVCLLIPAVQPVAVLLICAMGVMKLGNLLFRNIQTYRFENQMQMIARRNQAPGNWRARVIDYARWQVGWYDQKSILQRLWNAGTSISGTTVACAETIGDAAAALVQIRQHLP